MPIELISYPPLIPIWFYSYSAVAYGVAALISFLIGLFSYRFYKISSSRKNLIFTTSFLLLGIAFTTLTIASSYTYFYRPYFREYQNLNEVNYKSFNLYYVLSTLAYLLLVMLYLPKKYLPSGFFILYVDLWYIDSSTFHAFSMILIGFVLLRNFMNLLKKKNTNSLLVLFCFVMIELFHLLLLLLPFSVTFYLTAHALLATGFGSLLIMFIRVSRR